MAKTYGGEVVDGFYRVERALDCGGVGGGHEARARGRRAVRMSARRAGGRAAKERLECSSVHECTGNVLI